MEPPLRLLSVPRLFQDGARDAGVVQTEDFFPGYLCGFVSVRLLPPKRARHDSVQRHEKMLGSARG